MSDLTVDIDYDEYIEACNDPKVHKVLADAREAYAKSRRVDGSCSTCGAGPHGRCQLEGEGDCPEGCVTPEQW